MRLIRSALLVALVVRAAGVVEAAPVTIRTAPVGVLTSGNVRCGSANGGTSAGSVTMTLFANFSTTVLAIDTETLAANDSTLGTSVIVNPDNPPAWCECIVPNKAAFRCSFTYVNGSNVTVAPAE